MMAPTEIPTMAKSKTTPSSAGTFFEEAAPLRFDQKLVLLQWMLSLFGKTDFSQFSQILKEPELEGLTEDNGHKFLAAITNVWEFPEFPADTLAGYDQNIVKHLLQLNRLRAEPVRWKYFQWLTLLFTEIYLDRFFRAPGQLLADLNAFVTRFNEDKSPRDRLPGYEPADLRKLAFWNATGSGKTLLMHTNILQYRHYLALYG